MPAFPHFTNPFFLNEDRVSLSCLVYNPPVSASGDAGITGMCHHTQPIFLIRKNMIDFYKGRTIL
uniref:Uncharacterized protein n=1 Tax=Marmota marmota marmota TaxID=9994 RepID=A0A8C5YPK9_MARMA